MNDFNNAGITFEPMSACHQPEVMEIFNWYVENSFAAYPGTALPQEFYGKFLEMTRGYPAYIIKTGETVSGFCFLHPYSPFPTFKECAEISYFINPEHTGKGIGTLALRKLEGEAARLGVSTILASISSENGQSLAFHRKHGFAECGRLPGIGLKLGKQFDVVWMHRKLAREFDRKAHWENIYMTKQPGEVSWFQPKPETSLWFFEHFSVPLSAGIIDMGGGDSLLADHLLDRGYSDITVADISGAAVERAQRRLGNRAGLVRWVVADAASFLPDRKFDFWHDRAAFHFLTGDVEIAAYISTVHEALNPGGIMVIGTFSDKGPKKCSGLEVRQYTEATMKDRMQPLFGLVQCITVDHTTPSGAIQNFIFCSFRKK